MDYNFDINCSYGTLQKFLALNEHNQCDDDYDSKYYEMLNVMRRTQKENYNDEKHIINDTLYECGNYVRVSYISMSQDNIGNYPSIIGKIIFIDKDENNMFVLSNDNCIISIMREGCGYGFHNGFGFDIDIQNLTLKIK
jgi:hypothetical protein